MKNQKIENNKGEIVHTIYNLIPLSRFGNFIEVDLFTNNIKKSKLFIPLNIWNDEKELQKLIDYYNYDSIEKNNAK